MDVTSALAGFAFGLSLIVAIGAQNVFVLRQGLLVRHVGLVVVVCAASDAVLITLGVLGTGGLIAGVPALRVVLTLGGAAFLLAYGVLAARRALHPGRLVVDEPASTGPGATHGADAAAGPGRGWTATLLTCLALTWLNPHVYLDTLVLMGSVARGAADAGAFGVGAVVASVVWFAALGYGARLLAPLFARPAAWRLLDALVAVVMVALATLLLLGLR